jgi:ABC-2 family transporter protein
VTALTSVAQPIDEVRLRSVPWRRMAWVTWRQHRLALTGTAVLLGGLAVYLWRAGRTIHHAYAAVTACRPASSIACATMAGDFTSSYDHTATLIPALLQVVPALIGAFVGAPVLARELETGTFRYAWTQGFGRWRWTLAKLVPLALVVSAAAGVFSLLFSWYYRPFIADDQTGPLAAIAFDLRGIAFAAWTLAAFAIGALAGILFRRVVPAIVATLAFYTGLAVAAGVFARQHYLTPLVTSNPNVPGSSWIISQWWTKGGIFAFSGRPPISLLPSVAQWQQYCHSSGPGNGKPSSLSIAQCLTRHGYTQWTRYQPAGRFWPFQFIEGGWLLVLSCILIGMAVWLVRRGAT